MTNQTLTQNTNPITTHSKTKTPIYNHDLPYTTILQILQQQLQYNISETQATIKLHKQAIQFLNYPPNQNKPLVIQDLKQSIKTYISRVKSLHRERFFLQNQIHNYYNIPEYINKIINTNI